MKAARLLKYRYLRIEIAVKVMNRTKSRQNTAIEIQCIYRAYNERSCSKIDTMPIPIFTTNSDGVKLSTILRQPCLTRLLFRVVQVCLNCILFVVLEL